jgi:hypothetical protein
LATLLVLSAFGQDVAPQIVAPPKVKVGTPLFLDVRNVNSPTVRWNVYPTDSNNQFRAIPLYQGQDANGKPIVSHMAYFWSLKPGTYYFRLDIPANGLDPKAEHTLVVEGDKPNPQPDPEPDPDPDPDPTPVPGKRFVLIIRETKDWTAGQSQTVHEFRKYVDTKGHRFRMVDKDEVDAAGKTPAWLAKYKAKVSEAGVALPALVILAGEDGSGGILGIVPLPENGADSIQYLKGKGG